MSPRTRRLVGAVLLAAVLAGAVVAARRLLDLAIAPGGWYVVPFLAILAAVGTHGSGAGRIAMLFVLLSDLVVGGRQPLAGPGGPPIALPVHLAFDAAAGLLALGAARVLRAAARREARSDRSARRSARLLASIARRDAAARVLAAEVAIPRSVRQVADRFTVRAREMADAAAVLVTAPDGRSVLASEERGRATPGGSARARREPARDESLRAAAVADGVPRCRLELDPPDSSGSVLAPGQVAPGVRRVAVPLLAGRDVIAVGIVDLEPARAVTSGEVEGLVLLGRIAGEAMGRVELATQARADAARAAANADRIARLQHLAAHLGRELDIMTIAGLVVDAAIDGTRSSAAVLHRIDPQHGDLELVHARGYPAGLVGQERCLAPNAAHPVAEAARAQRTVTVDAASWLARFPGAVDVPGVAGLDALVAVALGNPATGVLLVGRSGADRFDPDDIGFLEAVAEHGAQALARAGLVEMLRDRDRRLGLTLGVARAGTWEVDVRRGAFDATASLRRLYSLPERPPIASLDAYLDLLDQADRDHAHREMHRVMSGGGAFALEFRARRRDGTVRRIHSVGRTFTDDAGRPVRLMAIDRDVTEERRFQEEREELLRHERDARRLSEAFFGVMSHELRTPVTTILAGTRLLSRSLAAHDDEGGVLADIADEAERLHRLIEDLLVLSRLERGNLALALEPVHLGHLVRRVIAHEARRWPETRFVAVTAGFEVAEGEETYVEQVLRNLLSNAAKYSPSGATVRIVLERGNGDVLVRVLDEGPGIGTDEVGDLFSLFYRSPATAAAASGAGIGLFVCDRLVQAMGGRIWARPRDDGEGSEFGFALLVADEDRDSAGPDSDGADVGVTASLARPTTSPGGRAALARIAHPGDNGSTPMSLPMPVRGASTPATHTTEVAR